MKILHTNFHKGWGGQPNRILVECRGLAELGHEVVIACPKNSQLHQRGEAAGLEIFTDVTFARGFRPQFLIHDARALRHLIRQRGFDIVHTHGSQDAWATAAAMMRLQPRPIVLRTKHNIFPIQDHSFNRLLYGRCTDGMVCVSSAVVEYCAAKPYLKRENLARIHSAIDFTPFSEGSRDHSLRQELGIEDRYVAGALGRLRHEKGHKYLLQALPKVIEQAPDFLLLIVGSGSLEDELKQMVSALGLEQHVRFLGFRTDIPRVLGALDLFVSPSLSEGLGTAPMEAGAARLPIISSEVGGVPDIIESGVTGLLVPPAQPEALTSAILTMYKDRAFAQRCGEAAAIYMEKTFGEKRLVLETDALYRMWLKKKRAAFRSNAVA